MGVEQGGSLSQSRFGKRKRRKCSFFRRVLHGGFFFLTTLGLFARGEGGMNSATTMRGRRGKKVVFGLAPYHHDRKEEERERGEAHHGHLGKSKAKKGKRRKHGQRRRRRLVPLFLAIKKPFWRRLVHTHICVQVQEQH